MGVLTMAKRQTTVYITEREEVMIQRVQEKIWLFIKSSLR